VGKNVRILLALALVLGIVISARNNLAWAGPAAGADQSTQAQNEPSVFLGPDGPGNKDKDKDKDKDKGTVKPPPGIVIPVTGGGTYSVGGICTMTIEYTATGLSDLLYLEVPVEKSRSVPFPESKGKIQLPGCHVLHYQSGQLMNEMGTEDGSWTICFAAQPKKTTTIYYYLDNLETVGTTWVPLETTVENGIACASANYSGVYAPASK
jgi:hypothetical protein